MFFSQSALAAQRLKWSAQTDCGYLVNVRRMSADANGNVYVAGEYRGEMAVHSARRDTTITKYTSEHWHKSFVTRYNSVGKPEFTVQFKSTGGNSDLTYINAIKALPSGDCLIAVDCKGSFDFIDAYGKHLKPGSNGRGGNLYCISAEGNIKWSAAVNASDISMIEAADDGKIYLYGKWGRFYSQDNCLLSFYGNGTPADTLRLNGNKIETMTMQGNRLWIWAAYPSYGAWTDRKQPPFFNLPQEHIGLFLLDLNTMKPEKKFHKASPIRKGWQKDGPAYYKAVINCTSDQLYCDMMLPTENSETTFADRNYKKDGGTMHIIRMNDKGEILYDKGFAGGYYNYSLIPAENGNIIMTAAAGGSAFRFENDSLVLPDHAMFINELVVMKLDSKLNRVWWFAAGGTASNYHYSQLCMGSNGSCFLSSDLLSSSMILNRRHDLIWGSGLYVMEFTD